MPTSLKTLWQFSRPHTIVGTTLSVLSLCALACVDLQALVSPGALITALLSTWGGNVYIVGLNQILDLELDRINKPYLPLPSGRMNLKQAAGIVLFSGALALITSTAGSGYLFLVIVISMILGTAYSLPPVRLKRFPFWSTFCILAVRGVVVNIGIYLHFVRTVNPQAQLPQYIGVLVLFMLGLSTAIAWFKDIPDVRGDRAFYIFTLPVRLGEKTVLRIGLAVLFLSYLGIIVLSFSPRVELHPMATFLFHAAVLVLLWQRAGAVAPENKEGMIRFYRFIWQLFYLEYLAFPVLRILV